MPDEAVADTRVRPAESSWVTLHPPGAGFKVDFPAQPEHERTSMASKTGVETIVQQWTLRDEEGAGVVMVGYNPLPPSAMDLADPEGMLAAVVQGQTLPADANALTREALVTDGIAGIAVSFTTLAPNVPITKMKLQKQKQKQKQLRVQMRFWVVGYRLYQLVSMFSAGTEAEVRVGALEAARVLESFHFTDDAQRLSAQVARVLWQRVQPDAVAADAADGAGRSWSVMMPGAPKADLGEQLTAFGKRDAGLRTVVGAFPPAMYTIQRFALSAPERMETSWALLDRWQAGLIKNLKAAGATVTQRQRISAKVDGHVARQLVLELKVAGRPATVARYLCVLTDTELFELGFALVGDRLEADASDAAAANANANAANANALGDEAAAQQSVHASHFFDSFSTRD